MARCGTACVAASFAEVSPHEGSSPVEGSFVASSSAAASSASSSTAYIIVGATEAGAHEADPSVSEGPLLPCICSREATNCSCLCLLIAVP
jgi:hypothetical protein